MPSVAPQEASLRIRRCNLTSFFEQQAWFELLLRDGMEASPQSLHALPVLSMTGQEVGRLHLMRPQGQRLLRSVDTYYSPVFGPVWGHDVSEAVRWLDVAASIKQLPDAGVLRLQPLEAEGQFLLNMLQALRSTGYAVDRYFCFGNWYEPIACRSFADYWRQRPSRLRNTVERARRRLDQKHIWRIEVLTHEGRALEQAIEAFQMVYARSWKLPEPCSGFMPGLIRMAASMGALRLGQLWLDGEVVASQVWLVHGGKANIYKLAYVPGHEKLSPGSVLTAALMQHVIDVDKVSEVDYLMGDDAYKQDWVTQRRERVGLVAFDRLRWRGLLAWLRHQAGRFVRRWRS